MEKTTKQEQKSTKGKARVDKQKWKASRSTTARYRSTQALFWILPAPGYRSRPRVMTSMVS
jgi:hypothetical protein